MPFPFAAPPRGARTLVAAGTFLLALLTGARAAPAAPAGHTSHPCLDCHAGMDSTLARTPHRVGPTDDVGARVACTDCHAGDSRHWEEDPAQFPMTRPAALAAAAEAKLCAGCHQDAHQQEMREKNAHLAADVACSGCHSVHHAAAGTRLLRQPESRLCVGCHGEVAGQFARPFRHPVNDRVMKCTDCHTRVGATARRMERSRDEVCFRCHAEMAGPFPFEHPATLGFSTEEGGCATCHDPHGSALPRMLRQPEQPPSFQLCRQCHLVPGHLSNPMHGTRWANVPCNDCHVDIHGSYVSRLFLSESLRSQGCFNVGCHQF